VETRGSVSQRTGDVGSLFFGSSGIRSTLKSQRERLSHTMTARRKRMSGIRGLVWEAYVLY
jgi:hypothetical protein